MTNSGALNDEALTGSPCSFGSTPLERSSSRFDDQELRIADVIPEHARGLCEVLVDKTNEGPKVGIESHRRWPTDPQGNAPAVKRATIQEFVTFLEDTDHSNSLQPQDRRMQR